VERKREKRRGRKPGKSLATAYRIQADAARVGFDWPNTAGPLVKVVEELEELKREMRGGKPETVEAELGDLLFAVVNLARKLGIDPGRALEKANAKFKRRFEAVEKLAEKRGLEMGKARLEELDQLWNEIKSRP
jgi:nucleoside triphosphate diphosphatase